MKILLLTGQSGAGKTLLQAFLAKNRELYNPILSYTDRPMRTELEYGHVFVSSAQMDELLQNENIVAETEIDGYRYCTVESQFDVHKINIYIVDENGVYDVESFFNEAELITIMLHRDCIDVPKSRRLRNVKLPRNRHVNFHIYNNSSIYITKDKVDLIARLGFFKGTVRSTNGLEEKYHIIEEIFEELDGDV